MKIAPHCRLLIGAALLSSGLLSGCGGSTKTTIPLSEDVFYSYSMIDDNGTLWGAGFNEYGELGINNLDNQSKFKQVTALAAPVTEVAQGANHTLAISGGALWAWGCNFAGRLGVGSSISSSISNNSYSKVPVKVTLPGNKVPVHVGAGWQHSVAAMEDGTVYSWGANNDGQLGINKNSSDVNYRDTPQQVVGVGGVGYLASIAKVSAGGDHSLALSSTGTVYGWGRNDYGEAGQATSTGTTVLAPVVIPFQFQSQSDPAATAVPVDIIARSSYSLALLNDGTVAAWGFNGYGQLGTGQVSRIPVPVPVQVETQVAGPGGTVTPAIFTGVSKISASGVHALALKVNTATNKGEVWSWGLNEQGQLGIHDPNAASTVPANVGMKSAPVAYATRASILDLLIAASPQGVTDVYAFGTQSFAKIGGVWYGWGNNGWGQLGQSVPDNDVAYLLSPVPIVLTPASP